MTVQFEAELAVDVGEAALTIGFSERQAVLGRPPLMLNIVAALGARGAFDDLPAII